MTKEGKAISLYVVLAERSEALPFVVEPSGAQVISKEVPERIDRIRAGLLDGRAILADPEPAAARAERAERVERVERVEQAERAVAAVHDVKLLDHLRHGVPAGQDFAIDHAFAAPGLDQETPITPGTWPAALNAAAATVRAAELTARERLDTYALVRPPGHHAGPGWYGGYCFLNNAVVAARTLRSEGFARVGILDVDYHLGNGTLACVAGAPDLAFASIHSTDPSDFPYRFETGPGLFGVPADPAADRYLALVADAINHLRQADVQAIVVSIGFDILTGDPHGSWSLSPEIFGAIGARIAAQRLPTVFVQEGGYGLPLLRRAARALAEEVSA